MHAERGKEAELPAYERNLSHPASENHGKHTHTSKGPPGEPDCVKGRGSALFFKAKKLKQATTSSQAAISGDS